MTVDHDSIPHGHAKLIDLSLTIFPSVELFLDQDLLVSFSDSEMFDHIGHFCRVLKKTPLTTSYP
jgi:hypothetical protein